MGWVGLKTGFGWYGSQSYKAECDHIEILAFCVNLNGLKPNDVTQEVWIGPEKPFVMKPLMMVDQTFVVIHSLPVGRYDDTEPIPRYTAYFMTYFTGNKATFTEAVRPFDQERSRVQYGTADYDLLKWVEAGRVYWLDLDDPELPLRNQPVTVFPYGNVEGLEGLCVIRDGKLKLYLGKRGQKPRSETEAENGIIQQLINAFRRGWRGG